MKTATWIDKSKWPRGEWDTEPDRVEFRHEGFVCVMKRQENRGHWCGYVGVPEGHPWHGKSYESRDWTEPDCHGGVTYGSACDSDPVRGVCHVPDAGEADHLWWIGFDFHHAWDIAPSDSDDVFGDQRYRNTAFVESECRKVAEQAAAVK